MANPDTHPHQARTAPDPARVLQTLLHEIGLTAPELGSRIGVARGTVNNWTAGRHAIDRFRIRAMAEALGDAIGDGRGPIPEDLFRGSQAEALRYLACRFIAASSVA